MARHQLNVEIADKDLPRGLAKGIRSLPADVAGAQISMRKCSDFERYASWFIQISYESDES